MLPVPLLLLLGMAGSPAVAPGGEDVRARYDVDLVGRSRAVFALPPGCRTIRSFRWVPDPDRDADAWRSARLRLVWDGDDPEAAGVDLPLGRFVSPEAGRPPGFVNRRPMPYRRSGRLVVDAEGPVRGSIRLDAGPGGTDLDDRGYLRAGLIGEPAGGEATEAAVPSGIGGESGGGEDPPVRYWYDRQPGPLAPRDRG